jgi:hypothetical protein
VTRLAVAGLLADRVFDGRRVIAIERGFANDLPILTGPEVRAIVAEAHARELEVTAHVTRVDDARRALEGGVDELAHMPCAGEDAALMRRLAARGIRIVATLHVEKEYGCDGLPNARAFVAAGGTLLYGSDMANPGIPFALDVRELALLREAGLTPLDVLRAATSEAGKALGRAPLGSRPPRQRSRVARNVRTRRLPAARRPARSLQAARAEEVADRDLHGDHRLSLL